MDKERLTDRSCEFCKWCTTREILVGEVPWCGGHNRETQLDSWCVTFSTRSLKK